MGRYPVEDGAAPPRRQSRVAWPDAPVFDVVYIYIYIKLEFASGPLPLSLEHVEFEPGGHLFSLKEQLALVCTCIMATSSRQGMKHASHGARSGRRRKPVNRSFGVATAVPQKKKQNFTLKQHSAFTLKQKC